jgi:tetratricopeptide (TPR) repeat protein
VLESSRTDVLATPTSPEAWGKLGQALHAAEFTTEARACYARAAEIDPTSPRWLHLLALLELPDQPDVAIQHLTRASELSGRDNDAPQFALAHALIERGRFAQAEPHLKRLLAEHPDHAAARLELARVLIGQTNLPAAAEILQPAVTNASTARSATLLLAQIRQREGNSEAATQLSRGAASMPRPGDWPDPFLREVQSLRADHKQLADQVNGLIQGQRTKEAGAILADVLKAAPDDPEGLLLLGRLRYIEKDCLEAEKALRRHLSVQPNSLNGIIQLGLSLLCQQRWRDAAPVFEKAIAIKPDFAQAHANLGYARSRAGDSSGALRSYRTALRCNPGDVNLHISLAEELARIGERAEAARHLDSAAAINPTDPRIRQLRERMAR